MYQIENRQLLKTHHPSFFTLNPTPSLLHSASFKFKPYSRSRSVTQKIPLLYLSIDGKVHETSPPTVQTPAAVKICIYLQHKHKHRPSRCSVNTNLCSVFAPPASVNTIRVANSSSASGSTWINQI